MCDRIDVIIPVYRPDHKLGQLIERLNHQTKKPDDGRNKRRCEGGETFGTGGARPYHSHRKTGI